MTDRSAAGSAPCHNKHVWYGGRSARYYAVGLGLLWLLATAVSLWPEPEAIALVAADHWEVSGGFTRADTPTASDIRRSIRRSPAAVFWRSWSPNGGAAPGQAATGPFEPPGFFVVPYGGFPGDHGLRLFVECLSTGATRDVTRARTNNQAAEALVHIPATWCPGSIRVVASSASTANYLTVGTPFAVGAISLLKSSFLGTLALAMGALGALLAIVLAGHLAAITWGRPRQGFLIGCIVLGLVSYLSFFAFFANAQYGRIAMIMLATGALVYVVRASDVKQRIACVDPTPYVIWTAAALGYIALLYAASNGGGAWFPNSRFLPVRWSSDNQLPVLTAQALYHGFPLSALPFGSWKVSDRPPLMSGAMVLTRVLGFLAAGDDGRYRLYTLYQCTGIALNALLIPVVYELLRLLAKSRAVIVGGVMIVAFSPFVIFNTVYTWPKIAAAAYALVAFALLIQERGLPGTRVTPVTQVTAALAGLAFALSMMAHGGTVFANAVLLIWAYWAGYLRSIRAAATTMIALVAIVLAWSLWQHWVQPPGNALVKFAFAGTNGWGEEDMGVAATIVRAYAGIDLPTWFKMKAMALRTLFGVSPEACGPGEMSTTVADLNGALRVVDFLYVVPTLRFMCIGLVAGLAIVLRLQPMSEPHLRHPALVLLALGVLSIALNILATWDCHILHHQSYQAMILLLLGAWLAAAAVGAWLAGALFLLSLSYTAVIWVASPILQALHRDYLALAFLVSLLALIGYLTAGGILRSPEHDEPGQDL